MATQPFDGMVVQHAHALSMSEGSIIQPMSHNDVPVAGVSSAVPSNDSDTRVETHDKASARLSTSGFGALQAALRQMANNDEPSTRPQVETTRHATQAPTLIPLHPHHEASQIMHHVTLRKYACLHTYIVSTVCSFLATSAHTAPIRA